MSSLGKHWKNKRDQKGSKNPNYRGGKPYKGNGGYLFVRIDGKLRRHHRVVMESHIGRKLKDTELVHHKNGDIQDNRIKNLEIMSFKKHAIRHELWKEEGWRFIRNRRGRFSK